MANGASIQTFLYMALLFAGLALLAPNARLLRPAALIACLSMAAYFIVGKFDLIGLAMVIGLIAIVSARWARDHIREAAEISMNDDEKMFQLRGVPGLSSAQTRELLDIGKWHDVAPDHLLMHQGQDQPFLQFVTRGAASIFDLDRVIGVCGPGDFLGEMSLVSDKPASATVRVSHPARILAFDPGTLMPLLDRQPAIKAALHEGMSQNLSAKISRMNQPADAAKI